MSAQIRTNEIIIYVTSDPPCLIPHVDVAVSRIIFAGRYRNVFGLSIFGRVRTACCVRQMLFQVYATVSAVIRAKRLTLPDRACSIWSRWAHTLQDSISPEGDDILARARHGVHGSYKFNLAWQLLSNTLTFVFVTRPAWPYSNYLCRNWSWMRNGPGNLRPSGSAARLEGVTGPNFTRH